MTYSPWPDGGRIIDTINFQGVDYNLHIQKITLPPQVWTITVFKGLPQNNSIVGRIQIDAPAGEVDVLKYLKEWLQKLFDQIKNYFNPTHQEPKEQWEKIEYRIQELRFDKTLSYPQIKIPGE